MKSYLEKSGGGNGPADLGSIKAELESFNDQLKVELQTEYNFYIDQLGAEVDASESNALAVIAQQLDMATTELISVRETAKSQIISTGAVTQGLLNGTITQANTAKSELESEIAVANASVTTLINTVNNGEIYLNQTVTNGNSSLITTKNQALTAVVDQELTSKTAVSAQELISTGNVQTAANGLISQINNAGLTNLATLNNQLQTNLSTMNTSFSNIMSQLDQKIADAQAVIDQAISTSPEGIKIGAIIYTANTSQWFGIGPETPKWLLCDGSTFDTAVYPALFNFLQSNVLPNLNNQFLRCITLTTGRAALSAQNESINAHTHPVNTTVDTTVNTTVNTTLSTAGAHTHTVSGNLGTSSGTVFSRTAPGTGATTSNTGSAGDHTHTATSTAVSTATSTAASACGNQAGAGSETRPANVAVFAVIRAL